MKIKTLIIMGLTAFLCLSSATAHAQSDKQKSCLKHMFGYGMINIS